MPLYEPPLRDYRFVLESLLDVEACWRDLPAYAEVGLDLTDSLLTEAGRILTREWLPLNASGDQEGSRWDDGVVTTPTGFKAAYRTWAEGGWIGLSGDPAYGGQGMPRALTVFVDEMLYATNSSLHLFGTLSNGASVALAAHGTEEQKQRYLPKLYTGEWTGAMALTESHAGSDLGLIRTSARPDGGDRYRLNGTKIFITCGEHDLAENIIHLVLARLPDAPAGSGGISLFLVPKFLAEDDGALGERNGVVSGGLEEKMGIHASPTNIMHYDDAVGYLVGEANRGLQAMFTMMNYERLSVGIQGLGLGEIAWQNAQGYAHDRLQGRGPLGPTAPTTLADPLTAHPDVRRMLLTQRALNEAGRAFAAYVGMQLDIAKHAVDEERQMTAERLAALLTPVAKAFFTDRGFECCVSAQQVLGGHGYVREWGLEQYVRDARIGQIYEGTNGIQALDLLGRKVVKDGGRTLTEFLATMSDPAAPVAPAFRARLAVAIELLASTTQRILAESQEDPAAVGAAATEYLDLFGYVVYAWLWGRMAHVARGGDLAEQKFALAQFYFDRVLPRATGLAESIRGGADAMMVAADRLFE